ncbi:gfo/Idh/MocA family oxidoreductase, partial [Candidatus Peregrinibacteria bacterium]|nr:gfo/Idh/MocA family oxidoreductase [Candidatus Peregrinibacteria bacterium]
MVKLAIIGVGEWGKNLLRNFYQIPEVGIKYCCDANNRVIEGLKGIYPNIHFKTDFKEIFEDNTINAVVV